MAAVLALLAPGAHAVPTEVRASSDVTVDLTGTTVYPEEVGTDDLAGTVAPIVFPGVPAGANLTAYALESGEHLLSFDSSVSLPGGVLAHPGDVVRYDGANYSIEFDAGAEGVARAASVDAVSIDSGSDLLLSFDITAALGALTVDDEDLVVFDGASFSVVFDASAEHTGWEGGADLDAVYLPEPHALLMLVCGSFGLLLLRLRFERS